uniref:Uncharacterized protein n=1 Tax=Ditylenchus dipsaci TaxID=166011 RepID=A0A915DQS3_9BILA
MKLSLEACKRSPFRDFDMHFWRGNESLQCFVVSCTAAFGEGPTLRVVCECANFTTTILEATTIGGGRNPFEELNDHIRCTHHTNTYCTVCRALRALPKAPTDIMADDTKQCLENGHLFKWPYSVLWCLKKWTADAVSVCPWLATSFAWQTWSGRH